MNGRTATRQRASNDHIDLGIRPAYSEMAIIGADANGIYQPSVTAAPRIQSGRDAPTHTAVAGTLYIRFNTAIGLYQNSDGATTWVLIGSATGGYDLNGGELILDADADTSITADTDDEIDIRLNGADDFKILANIFRALSGSVLETNTINETTAASGVTVDGLLIKDSGIGAAFTVAGALTSTGLVNSSTLDQNAIIDQDTADTAGTGAAFDSLGTTTSATGSAQIIHAKVKQLTNAKTAGVTSALAVAAEGLAGDTSGATMAGIDFEAPTANGGSALYPAMYVRAGHSSTIDASLAATGENDYVIGANLASAYERRDSVGSTVRDCTTTGARRTEQIIPLELQGGYRLQSYAIPRVEEFYGDVGATLPPDYVKDVQGSATGDYISAQGAGVYRLATVAVSEAEGAQIQGGDSLHVLLSKEPIIEFRVRISPAGATFTADERIVIGLVSAHANAEDDLDATTYNLWFRIEGASLAVVVEKDDNAANVDDQASGLTVTKDSWHIFRIDCSTIATPILSMDGTAQSGAALSMSAASAQFVQPIVCMQRDAGSEINTVDVDYIAIYQRR